MEKQDKLELNNKVILLRKSLKSIFNQTKLNLSRKIKNLKKNEKQKQSAARKESEVEALKRLKPTDVPLCEAVHSELLQKTLTNPASTEIDRAVARVLLNPLVQKTIKQLKEKYGPETVETFLKDNEKNIKKNLKQKLENPKKSKEKKTQNKKPDKDNESEGVESEEDNSANSEEESGSEAEDNFKNNLKISENNSSSEDKIKVDKESESLEAKDSVKKAEQHKAKPSKRKRFKEEVIKRTTDSFFVDSTGQNYLANVADGASSASEEDDAPAFVRKIPQKGSKIVQGKKFKPIQKKRFDETPPAKRPFQNKKQPDFKAKQPQNKIESFKKPEVKSNVSAKPDDGDIHPSWKAKAQMRKTQIQDYQGTKIKFDD